MLVKASAINERANSKRRFTFKPRPNKRQRRHSRMTYILSLGVKRFGQMLSVWCSPDHEDVVRALEVSGESLDRFHRSLGEVEIVEQEVAPHELMREGVGEAVERVVVPLQ